MKEGTELLPRDRLHLERRDAGLVLVREEVDVEGAVRHFELEGADVLQGQDRRHRVVAGLDHPVLEVDVEDPVARHRHLVSRLDEVQRDPIAPRRQRDAVGMDERPREREPALAAEDGFLIAWRGGWRLLRRRPRLGRGAAEVKTVARPDLAVLRRVVAAAAVDAERPPCRELLEEPAGGARRAEGARGAGARIGGKPLQCLRRRALEVYEHQLEPRPPQPPALEELALLDGFPAEGLRPRQLAKVPVAGEASEERLGGHGLEMASALELRERLRGPAGALQ